MNDDSAGVDGKAFASGRICLSSPLSLMESLLGEASLEVSREPFIGERSMMRKVTSHVCHRVQSLSAWHRAGVVGKAFSFSYPMPTTPQTSPHPSSSQSRNLFGRAGGTFTGCIRYGKPLISSLAGSVGRATCAYRGDDAVLEVWL